MTIPCASRYLLVSLIALLALAPQSGRPAMVVAATLTFTVNSTADTNDATPGDGICADASGRCTLRAATQEADAQPTGRSITISVPAGTYGLTLGTLLLTANAITISGALSSTTIISGNHTGTVMSISPTVQAALNQITITGGKMKPGRGGGLVNAGLTDLTQSAVLSNTAYTGAGIYNMKGGQLSLAGSTVSGNSGTGIANYGTLTLSNSTLSGNSNSAIGNAGGSVNVTASTFSNNTGTDGGGISNNGGTVNVAGSTFSGNTAYYYGGGFYNYFNGTATVSGSTFSSNTAGPGLDAGGGIYNLGTLSVTNSILSNNVANSSYGGGGIYSGGPLTVANSTLSGNSASQSQGGGIFSDDALTMTATTFSGNSANEGGGLYNSFGTMSVMSSTFSNNTATSYGGGIANAGLLFVTDSTLKGNVGNPGGAVSNGCNGYGCSSGALGLFYDTIAANGVANITGTIGLKGAIVTNGTAGCSGKQIFDHGYNLDGGTSCGFSQSTDITNTNPQLGPLANNGGPTQTMALLPGSPAIDHGGTSATGCPAADQRGLPRPDEARDSGACDMGAYESQGIG